MKVPKVIIELDAFEATLLAKLLQDFKIIVESETDKESKRYAILMKGISEQISMQYTEAHSKFFDMILKEVNAREN